MSPTATTTLTSNVSNGTGRYAVVKPVVPQTATTPVPIELTSADVMQMEHEYGAHK